MSESVTVTETLPETVEISPVDTSDIETVVELWLALVRSQQQYGTHLKGEANKHRVQQALARYAASDRLLVATHHSDETPIGFVMFRVEQQNYAVDVSRGLIENLYVSQEHRGACIGSALIERAESALAERAVEVIGIEAMAANEFVHELYRRHGYEPHRMVFEKSIE